ncbi:MAG: ABC transporter ATP-binding protein [Synergistaceae bacterium]|nr:ABC transporter ATP-binding protein [Synergistaceae bacterium]
MPLVEMKRITKRFSGVVANSNVDFSVEYGEVHALLGENGAGKSTLMNILYGLYHPDSGEIYIDGVKRVFRSPSDAILSGVGMVHQHFMLVETQTVWENMILGMKMPFVLPKKQIIKKIAELSEKYNLKVNPLSNVWQLSIGEQQRAAVLQMLYRNAKVLILDEPTAVLTPQESKELFVTIRNMTALGHSVIFISHKMNEVMNETDRVTVLRKGETAGTVNTKSPDTSQELLSEMMMGRKVSFDINKPKRDLGKVVFDVNSICASNDRGGAALKNISFRIRKSEIFGVAGVAGNGQLELCEAIYGLRVAVSGYVKINEKDLTNASARALMDCGVHYIPADRRSTGMVTALDVKSNSILTDYWIPPISSGNSINWKEAGNQAKSIIEQFNVSTPSVNTAVKNLSGGNLQKLMLGRELSNSPEVLIVMHPTWGLDVSATRYIRERIISASETGTAVLLISEDIEELLALSDRLAIIFKGEFMGIIADPKSMPIEKIGLMMAGTHISEVL